MREAGVLGGVRGGRRLQARWQGQMARERMAAQGEEEHCLVVPPYGAPTCPGATRREAGATDTESSGGALGGPLSPASGMGVSP